MKHLEVGQKYLATRRILNSLLGVLSGDETLRLVPDILLPGYIKASIPTIVFNTSNMTKLNGKSGKKGKTGPCVHKKKFPKAHLFIYSYIAKPIAWRILQEVYLPVFMLSMLINHNKTRKLNAFSLP